MMMIICIEMTPAYCTPLRKYQDYHKKKIQLHSLNLRSRDILSHSFLFAPVCPS